MAWVDAIQLPHMTCASLLITGIVHKNATLVWLCASGCAMYTLCSVAPAVMARLPLHGRRLFRARMCVTAVCSAAQATWCGFAQHSLEQLALQLPAQPDRLLSVVRWCLYFTTQLTRFAFYAECAAFLGVVLGECVVARLEQTAVERIAARWADRAADWVAYMQHDHPPVADARPAATLSMDAVDAALTLHFPGGGTALPPCPPGEAPPTCAVCMDELDPAGLLRRLPCTHVFHAACIDPWLTQRSATCPVCRHVIV